MYNVHDTQYLAIFGWDTMGCWNFCCVFVEQGLAIWNARREEYIDSVNLTLNSIGKWSFEASGNSSEVISLISLVTISLLIIALSRWLHVPSWLLLLCVCWYLYYFCLYKEKIIICFIDVPFTIVNSWAHHISAFFHKFGKGAKLGTYIVLIVQLCD